MSYILLINSRYGYIPYSPDDDNKTLTFYTLDECKDIINNPSISEDLVIARINIVKEKN